MTMAITYKRALAIFFCIFVFYTEYLQYVWNAIPNMVAILGMLVLGVGYLLILASNKSWTPFGVKEFELMLIFFIITFISGLITSTSVSAHVTYWISSFEYFLLVPCLMYILRDQKDISKFCFFYMLFAIICAVTLIAHPVSYYESGSEGVRYSLSTSLNVNLLGQFLTLGSWCCCVLMTIYQKFRKFGYIVFILLFCANNLTKSRKNFIAILIIFLVWFILCWIPENKNDRFKIAVFSLCLVGIACYAYVHFYLGSDMATRMGNIFVDSLGNQNKRFDMYESAVELFKQSPLFGWGYHAYGISVGKPGGYSHATYPEVLANSGILGCALLFGMYIYSVVKVIKLLYRTRNILALSNERNLLKSALILWIVIAFMSTGVIYIYELVCFIIWGVLFSLIRCIENEIRTYCNGTYYLNFLKN